MGNTTYQEKETKEQKAFRLVTQAKEMMETFTQNLESCQSLLDENLKAYDDAKEALHKNGLDESIALLQNMQCDKDCKNIDDIVVFEIPKKETPIVVKDIYKSRFLAFIVALFMGLAVGVGLIFQATQKLGVHLGFESIPSIDTIQSIFSSFSISAGLEPDMMVGLGIFLGAIVVSMIVVYMVFRAIKKSKNLHFSVKQFVEVELYIENNSNCKEETGRVNAHIKESINIIKTYEVLLREEVGRLNRIFYIEGQKENISDYHKQSLVDIENSKILISSIIDFISLPMSNEGKVSKESLTQFITTKKKINKIIDTIYN